ncbi:MAG: hypothetical protein AAGU21_12800 [Solidesulfovibrio sp.]|uniref:capsular polysaccharide export protein, LipB/KpsS family n=1 Tax=Solidesulfovibrio sp. TaxID=2910990 RepID=UPI00315848CC
MSSYTQTFKSIKQIKEHISNDEIKIVSFDIFDTMLLRPCVTPSSIFKIIGKKSVFGYNFCKIRINAESAARKKRPAGEDDITLDSIYNEVQKMTGLDDEEIEKVKQLEIETELNILRPRLSVKDIYDHAQGLGKKIIIISDMYLPRDVLAKLLRINGFTGYDALYVSSELKLSKGSGRLFDFIIETYKKDGIIPSQIVHLGDNLQADIAKPAEKGIFPIFIPKTIDCLRKTRLSVVMSWLSDLNETDTIIGFLANKIFDDPFTKFDQKTLFNGDTGCIGYVLFGPLIFMMCLWMMRELSSEGVKKICFIWRDGFLPSKVYNIIAQHLKTMSLATPTALHMTRSMRSLFEAKDFQTFVNYLYYYGINSEITISNFIRKRLHVDDDETYNAIVSIFRKNGYSSENDRIGSLEAILPAVCASFSIIQKYLSKKLIPVDTYIKKVIDFDTEIAFWDIGYKGTVSSFFSKHYNVSIPVYHFIGYKNVYPDIPANKIRPFIVLPPEHRVKTIFVHLTEDVFASTEGSVTYVNQTGNDISLTRDPNTLDETSVNSINLIQRNVIQFAMDFSSIFKDYVINMFLDREVFYNLFLNYMYHTTLKDALALKDFSFKDSSFLGTQNIQDVYRTFIHTASDRDLALHGSLLKQFYTDLQLVCPRNDSDTPNVFVIGPILGFDKGTINYLNTLNKLSDDYKICIINEAKVIPVKNKIALQCDYFNTPRLLFQNTCMATSPVVLSDTILQKIQSLDYLSVAAQNLRIRHPDFPNNYPELVAFAAYIFAQVLIKRFRPKAVLLWNKFSAYHHVVAAVCKQFDIPTLYIEFGLLPGTFSLDQKGQMGESDLACSKTIATNFLPDADELCLAEKVLSYLRESKLNRNIQPVNSNLKNFNLLKRPTVFYAGQNDCESGLQPYTETSQKFHSPNFKTSIEPLHCLSQMAATNNWNLLFKPHPIMRNFGKKYTPLKHVTLIDDIDINDIIDVSDVVLTILSQVSYIALIREKPVVMLGYTQLRHAGCTYNAFDKDDIEREINKALEFGLTVDMKEKFKNHVALLLRDHLYDDLTPKHLSFGQPPSAFHNVIKKAIFSSRVRTSTGQRA